MKNKHFRLAFRIWLTLIIILSVIPNLSEQKIELFGSPFRLDYLEHFGVFFILGTLFILSGRTINFKSIGFLLSFAFLMETVQLIIPGRAFNPWDFIYNIFGLIVAIILSKRLINNKLARKIGRL